MNKITIQDGNAAEIVIYVNWKDEEILSEAEYEAKLEEETKIVVVDDYDFGQWLCENYTAPEIWDMNEEDKEEVKAQWFRRCRECMEIELGYERRVLI